MDVSANPLGLDRFEFCEFTSPEPDELARQFEQIGFVPAHRHPTKQVTARWARPWCGASWRTASVRLRSADR